MLQQTQVAAVIPYYLRFMARFPNIAALAHADQDEVLRHWSGLGYYSRARNLHAAAQAVMQRHGGMFPAEPDVIAELPGIGRSTAAAIAAFSFGARAAILDGNVKRVLARHFAVDGWPGQPAVEKQLWQLADSLLPHTGIEAYTQGLMDLGATLCTRGKPGCAECPLQASCVALRDARVSELPAPKPRKALPERRTVMLLLCRGAEILLEKRPPSGIWGGLWSLPEAAPDEDAREAASTRYGLRTELLPPLPEFGHTFSHFHLRVTPQPLAVVGETAGAREPGALWLERDAAVGAALPAPVRALLRQLR